MKKNNITINDKRRLLKGFLETCTAVGKTMGSEGSLAIYESEMMSMPIVTKDGISVAKSMFYSDMHESMGNYMAKQSALRTVAEIGDNTSTSLVLAKAIVENSLKKPWFKRNPLYNKKVEKGFEIALEETKEHLVRLSGKITDKDILKIATISANNNKEIGEIVLKAFKAVGKDGIIDFKEDADKLKTEVEITNGMLLNKGYKNPLLRNRNNGNFESEETLVVVYNGYEIGHNKEVFEFINTNKGKSILLIVERCEDEDFIRRIASGNQSGFDISLVECPFFDTDREMLLQDIAIFTGAEVFIQGSSTKVVPGTLDRVIITNNTSSLIKKEIRAEVKSRIKDLETELKNTPKKDTLKRRIQLLKGVASTIRVGAVTETERREIFDRVEDAVYAVRASVDEGWIAGGGSTLLHISKNLKSEFENKDIQHGYNLIRKSLQAPFLQICENANRNGKNYIDLCNKYGVGYNAFSDEISNLIEDGVIDSVKGQRVSLENAISVAKLLLNIKVVVSLKGE